MTDDKPLPAQSEGGPGELHDLRELRAELRHHRLFLRALDHGWNLSPIERRSLATKMLAVLHFKTATRATRTKSLRMLCPTIRERIQAARVLAALAGQDQGIYLECLRELHVRERAGLLPYAKEAEPLTAAEEGQPSEAPKQLCESAIKKLYRDRFPSLIEDLHRDG